MNEVRDRTVLTGGAEVGRGSRVRLRPSHTSDIFDLELGGRTAEVEAVEEDMEGRVHLVVTLEDDDGRDFRTGLGHRFFFSPDEVEPLDGGHAGPRILIAGIGNVFLADDAFGPEVVAAMRGREVPAGVHVADFGIRGMDLAYRLLDGYDVAVLVDAAPRGGTPGTLYVIEAGTEADTRAETADGTGAGGLPEAHGMDPVQVLALARQLGRERLPRVVILGCEPAVRMRGDEPDVVVGLSEPVGEAVGEAVVLLEELTGELLRDPGGDLGGDPSGRPSRDLSRRTVTE
ncbi:hydrogenase maturation protease [Streptomyces sp. WMMB 714]|uniref:hydrogenase maturation protease n=1 Tax=Streptomyces sp. WMMB 714 TaxID=1286822 RepID=UPI000823F60A|nr:hydrogenase maturation protease [Streptomyces sp. WMMB 714]